VSQATRSRSTPGATTGNNVTYTAGPAGTVQVSVVASNTSETPQDARKFTGHERDGVNDANALDYMHARYYASAMGRFLSVDPAIGNPAVPQSWNRYAYVTNNPITRLDPDGRDEYYFAWRSTSTDVGHAAIAIENRDRSGRLTGTLTVRHLWPHDGGEARKLDKTFVARADYRVEIVPQAKLMDVDGGEGRPADGIVRIKGDATQDAAVTSALAATAAANPLYVGPLNTCSTYAATGVAATGITPTERGTVTVMTGRLFLPQVVWIRVITPVGVYMSLAKSADTRVQVVKPIAEPKADITVTKQ
jgi:RHS repeat-associated protein